MRPWQKTAIIAAAAVVASVVLFLVLFDWNVLRGALERQVAARTGRTVSIGALDVELGWRIRVVAGEVTLSNPAWARRPNLLEAQRIEAVLSLPVLLRGALEFHELALDRPRVALERREDRGTWEFDDEGKDRSGTPPRIRRLRIDDGAIELIDPAAKTELSATLAAAGAEAADDLKVSARGRYEGAPFSLDATGPGILPLADTGQRYPLEATVRAGATSAHIKGTVTDPAALRALDLALELAGDDLSKLRPLIGVTLPPTPPYKLRGRLRRDAAGWHLDDASGKIGDTDVAGRFAYKPGPPRPHLQIDLTSNLLDFDDLGPLIGAPPKTTAGETASPEQRRQAQRLQRANQALPDQPFDFARWQRMDVDASLSGKKVLHPPALPISSLDAKLRIREGILRVDPLDMQAAGGRIAGRIELDGRAPPLRGTAELDFKSLRLRELFPTVEAMKTAHGIAHGKARLAGTGSSVAALMGSADGRITLAIDHGTISNLVLELMGLDAGEALLIFATGDREIELRCAVADLDVRKGVAASEVLVLDTADTLVVGTGVIDLRKEALDLTLYPRPKDKSLLSARSPLKVRGTLRNPTIAPDAKALASRGIAATLLGLVNPLLALAPFIETGPGKDSDCAGLVANAKTWKDSQGSPTLPPARRLPDGHRRSGRPSSYQGGETGPRGNSKSGG